MLQCATNINKKTMRCYFAVTAIFTAILAIFVSALPSSSFANDAARTMILLDGSKSMWGQVKRKRKYLTAKAAVEKILTRSTGEATVGVMAFGHVRRKSCSTMELIKAPGLQTDEDALTKLKNFRPRNRAPISRALEVAARELDYKKQSAKIIMIIDGPDQCRRDPCKTLKTLRETAYDLSVHVIGLNLTKRNMKRYQCFTDNAADALYHVKTAEELDKILSNLTSGYSDNNTITYSPPKVKEEQITSLLKGQPRIKLLAVLAQGQAPIRDGVTWRIYKAIDDRTFRSKPVAQTSKSQAVIPLKPGRYIAEAIYGNVVSEIAVEAPKKGSLTHILDLQAGILEIETKEKSDGETLDGVFYSLYKLKDASQPGAFPIARSSDSTAKFIVKSGDYQIVATHGGNSLKNNVTVFAGESSKITLEMKTGLLKLATYAAKNTKPLDRIFYSIFKYDENIDQKSLKAGDEVTRTAAAQPTLRLPAGRYIVKAEHDLAHSFSHVLITPGQTTEAKVILKAARLSLSSVTIKSKKPIDNRISYRILSLGNKTQEIARTTSAQKDYLLSPGKYRILGRYGSINAEQSLELTLKAGENRKAVLIHDAGTVRLSLYEKGGKFPRVNVFWTLLDATGNEVWRTSRPTPEMVLKSGNYKILAESSSKIYERKFEIKKGKHTEIRLDIEP